VHFLGGNLFQSGVSPTVNLPSQAATTINNNNNNNNISSVENNNSNNLVLDNRLNLALPDLDGNCSNGQSEIIF
jgi:hypothetical protein